VKWWCISAPPPPAAAPLRPPRVSNSDANETGGRQQQVWQNVRHTRSKLSSRLGSQISSGQSESSLQLALENEKLLDAQKGYINALKAAGENTDDIIGFVFAVNGTLNSADAYPSNGLFRKMWGTLLNASAIEAIGQKGEPNVAPPAIEKVTAFLAQAEAGKSSAKPLTAGVRLETREADAAYFFETTRATGWVHRNYLAR